MLIAGRFRVEAEVGAGSAGVVYRAHDEQTGELVALKLFHHTTGFAGEAARLAGLVHPAVARLLSYGVMASGRPWLAMEWIEGETLAARLERGPLAAAECVGLARRVGGALAEAHRLGLVHGDLKPANLMLEHGVAARVRVLDFGAGVRGSVGYQAPEGAGGPRADLFALGCVLAECLLPDAPPALRSLVERLRARDPAERPADGEALLDTLAAGEPARRFDAEERVLAVVVSSGDGEPRVVAGPDAARRARSLAGPSSSVALGIGRSEGGRLVPDPALVDRARAHLVDGELTVDASIERLTAPPRARAPLIGRDRELAFLEGALAECAQAGQSRAVLIVGRAGLGKSRLLLELGRRAPPLAPLLLLDGLERLPAAAVEAAGAALRERVVCVVAAARPEAKQRFPSLWPGSDVHELRLAPLSRRAGRLLAQALGAAEQLAERAGGNPFLLEELAASGGGLPLTVRARFEEVLDRVGRDGRRTLRAAGQLVECDAAAVAALLEEPVAAVAEHLEELVRREVLDRTGDRLVFADPLLREVVRASHPWDP